jgi:3-hydroxyacyl-CoA dehydrogenase
MVRMVICGIEYLLSRCDIVVEAWNEDIELTDEVISTIKEQCPDEVVW